MAFDISRVTSETVLLFSMGIFFKVAIISEDFVPVSTATRDPLPPLAFLLVIMV
jgi:hypothetical protein